MKKVISVLCLALSLSMPFVSNTALAKDKEIIPPAENLLSRVNINKASAEQLATSLKGVGLKKAQAIIDYRKQYGDFKSVDELSAVKGIGEKTVQKNRSKIAI
ncbi:helix-hairpin-helix domain-containing protein [Kangiella sp. TOML190]|uniref:ComEA family DNA-binding protein n=1 Tax=Kangiella sp. TOML190 TaxID=2931351 RepID=UPI00203CAF15|nr:helix-hairpin-helix domain-containing protein [Kangiella sp. TOML190]